MKNFLVFFLIFFRSSLVFSAVNCSDPLVSHLTTDAKLEIEDRLYMTLASSDLKGFPWNTPLYTAYDSHYTFFWLSEKSSRHSRNIRDNSKVFVVIYDSTDSLGTGFGVYMQGHARELNNIADIAYGLSQIENRAGASLPPPENYQGSFRERVYKFVPEKFWGNTFVEINGEFIDRRIELTGCL